jgi:predicted RNA methylase
MPSHLRVEPLRVTNWDGDLHTNVRRVIGFTRACEECGERSPRCASVAMANGWLRDHRITMHRGDAA